MRVKGCGCVIVYAFFPRTRFNRKVGDLYTLRYLYYLLRLARNNSPWLHSPANWTVQLSRPMGAITSYTGTLSPTDTPPQQALRVHRAKMYETCTRAPQQACIAALIHVNKMLTRRRANSFTKPFSSVTTSKGLNVPPSFALHQPSASKEKHYPRRQSTVHHSNAYTSRRDILQRVIYHDNRVSGRGYLPAFIWRTLDKVALFQNLSTTHPSKR